MKAIVHTRYGPPEVLHLKEVERPIPRDDEVLVKVNVATVTNADCYMRRAETFMARVFLGFRKPKRGILGTEISGEIDAVGKDVKRFRKGDRVYGFTGFRLGGYAEYVCLKEKGSLVMKPEIISDEEAVALVDGPTTAYHFLKEKADVCKGQKVLINGASGSIGTAAIQLAKYFGADVTAVCSSANFDLVRSLGADDVIDYSKDDFTTNGMRYDVIFDAVGKSSFSRCKGSLKHGGCYLTTRISPAGYIQTAWTSIFRGKRMVCGISIDKTDALEFMNKLVESRNMRAIIDRRYPLKEISEAHHYVEEGHKRGNVVIIVDGAR